MGIIKESLQLGGFYFNSQGMNRKIYCPTLLEILLKYSLWAAIGFGIFCFGVYFGYLEQPE